MLVLDATGQPLYRYDPHGIWQQPIDYEQIAPSYWQALLASKQQRFWNSTLLTELALTYKAAHLLQLQASAAQTSARTAQLVCHYTQQQRLALYANLVPMGGNRVGIEAASRAYLQKSAQALTPSEAALLVAIANQPSRLRPDRYPKLAEQARNQVLKVLETKQVWDQDIIAEALQETPYSPPSTPTPHLAPLYTHRLLKTVAVADTLSTPLYADWQSRIEQLLLTQGLELPENTSIAVMVLENTSGLVRAYSGSLALTDKSRAGYVDVVPALRSPGSTLKPFLYGLSLDAGLIHSGSRLSDTSLAAEPYHPANLDGVYRGAVSVEQALRDSLNVPAVRLLQHLTPEYLVEQLRKAGLKLVIPHNEPNLSVILGGAGVTLESLVGTYRALASGGTTIKPRLLESDPIIEQPLLSAGAAWIIFDILKISPLLALKTGVSYGFRDNWAVGVSKDYTVGVWVGRPDGKAVNVALSHTVAEPLVKSIMALVPSSAALPQPSTVSKVDICWPSGLKRSDLNESECEQSRMAWIVGGKVPATLPTIPQR